MVELEVAPVLERVIDVHQKLARTHRFAFVHDAPVVVQADLRRFERVLDNLLSNAVKFSSAGGEVRVTLDEKGGMARITVRDQGLGIPTADLPELFTRYREVIQEQLDRLEDGGIIRLTVPREVLVPLVLNTVLGFGLYYVVTRDDESCLRALSAFRTLASTLIEPVP